MTQPNAGGHDDGCSQESLARANGLDLVKLEEVYWRVVHSNDAGESTTVTLQVRAGE